MTAADFPYPAVGMVHVANEMSWQRPVTADERLTLSCWAEGPRPHRKGVTVDLCGTAGVGDDLAWQGRSTYLVRGARMPDGSHEAGQPVGDPAPETTAEPPSPLPDAAGLLPRARWRLPADLGRRYAAVAGDINPIHLHPLAARALGFPRAIAHGMWAHARVLSALAPASQLPAGRVRVGFQAPLLLPGTAQLAARPDGSAFAVTSAAGERTHLAGTLQPADFTNRPPAV
uniref:MaoC family dehydratase n=1 Tax=Ornithinicoccus halotolerans TaxID=1748220 RepID=UPI0038992561